MFFHPWFVILIGLILSLSGCMKAAERIAVPSVERVRIALDGPYDAEIPREYRELLRDLDATDPRIAHIFLAVAGHFEREGEEGKALNFLDRAENAFALRKDLPGEAQVFSRRVLLLLHSGHQRDALDLAQKGTERWSAQPLRAFSAWINGQIAMVQGDLNHAGGLFRQSLQDNTNFQGDARFLELRRDAELGAGMVAVLSDHLARLLPSHQTPESPAPVKETAGAGLGNLKAVLALNNELRGTGIGPLISAVDFQRTEAEAYAFMGLDAGMRGDGEESLRHLIYAAELSRSSGFRDGEIQALIFLGELGLTGINAEAGVRAAAVLRERADRLRATPYRIWARLLMARYDRIQGRIGEAIASLQEADGIISTRSTGSGAGMFTQVCRVQRRAVYETLVELLANEGRIGEALNAAEKGKQIAIVDLLAGRDIAGSEAARELLRREREVQDQITILQSRILHISGEGRTGEFLERLKGTEEIYHDLLARLGAEDEKLLPFVTVRGADFLALQRLLDEETTLFDYFTTERVLYVWAIQRQRVHLERIDITREAVRRLVFSFLEAIRDRKRRETDRLSRRAYDLLLKPVIPFVSGERIGFIPDDSLHYLPFAAMRYRGRFLAEGFSIFTLTGADSLEAGERGKRHRGLRILAVGDPDLEDEALDLRYGPEELERIRKRISGTTVLRNQLASEAQAAETMAGYDILHFSVRGQFDPDDPLRSGLLLTPGAGQDGILTVLEIFRLRCRGITAVLSGCDPLPEGDPEGMGLSALQRAFLYAGSPSVVSTLWLVEDRAVAHLVDLFYRELEKRGSFSDSLRAAQLQLLRQGYPPYVWAAFIVTGMF